MPEEVFGLKTMKRVAFMIINLSSTFVMSLLKIFKICLFLMGVKWLDLRPGGGWPGSNLLTFISIKLVFRTERAK